MSSATKKKALLLVAAVGALWLTLEPFFSVGLTTGDDLEYLTTRLRGPRYWLVDAQIYATLQGRFYFLFTKPFYLVPYLVDSFAYTKAVQYAMLLVSFMLFGQLVGRLAGSRAAGLLCAFVPVASLTITPNSHIATIAYPFYFSFSMSLLCGSALMLLRYRRGGGRGWLVGSVALAAVGVLFYEQYLLFVLAGVAIVFVVGWHRHGLAAMFSQRRHREQWLPYTIVVAVYVLLYVGWRRLLIWQGNDDFYAGASVASSVNWHNFAELLWRLPQTALPWRPMQVYGGDIAAESAAGFSCSLPFVAKHLAAKAWLSSLLNVGVAVALLLHVDTAKIRWRTIALGIPTAIALAMLSHTLIALTPKYNTDWFPWICGYVTTYFSLFGFAAAGTLALVAVVKMTAQWRYGKPLSAAVCGMALLMAWMCNAYTNELLALPWQRTQARFAAIDRLAQEHAFDTIANHSIIYNHDLVTPDGNNPSYNIFGDGRFVDMYIELRSNRSYLWAHDSTQLSQLAPEGSAYYTLSLVGDTIGIVKQ